MGRTRAASQSVAIANHVTQIGSAAAGKEDSFPKVGLLSPDISLSLPLSPQRRSCLSVSPPSLSLLSPNRPVRRWACMRMPKATNPICIDIRFQAIWRSCRPRRGLGVWENRMSKNERIVGVQTLRGSNFGDAEDDITDDAITCQK